MVRTLTSPFHPPSAGVPPALAEVLARGVREGVISAEQAEGLLALAAATPGGRRPTPRERPED